MLEGIRLHSAHAAGCSVKIGLQLIYIGSRLKFNDLIEGQLKLIKRIFCYDLLHFLAAGGFTQDQPAGPGLSAAGKYELPVLVILIQKCFGASR